MPVQVTMQPLQPAGAQQPPVPSRWAEAVRNVEAAQRTLDDLSRQLDGALYLDEEAWQQAVPHAQFSAALHVSLRRRAPPLPCSLAAARKAWRALACRDGGDAVGAPANASMLSTW